MSFDRTEQLIRDAFADEAERRVDPREVLAAVRSKQPRRRYGLVLATAAVVVVVAAVAAFVVPEVFKRSSPTPVGDQQEQSASVTAQNVLVVGVDTNDRTDSLVLTQVRADGSVGLVSLPRDAWVQVPGGEMSRLNAIYQAAGIDTLLATVGDLTGVRPDHYVVVDTTAVGRLTDAVGGVPVCLKAAITDPMTGGSFAEGRQTLNGAAALAFIRQRHGLPNGGLDRDVRLQAFLQSLAHQLRDAEQSQLAAAVSAVDGNIRTDQDLDLLGFAVDLSRATALQVGTIPVGDMDFQTPEGASVIEVDPAQVKEFVAGQQDTPPVGDDVPCVW